MLGQDVLARLAGEDVTAVAADRAALDVADPESVRAAFGKHRPAVVVNCAAWTAVDDAESQEDAALRVNGTGPAVLAEACRGGGGGGRQGATACGGA
ncbi:sugar nucleotide-binding protein, partial [Streptomyces sp. NPDC059616]|uniref:sugar nucleotide-binding protein n=1 Tax=Streptomyces sp. NPDC059616 TaxID=3346886 RepID=UPI00368F10D7